MRYGEAELAHFRPFWKGDRPCILLFFSLPNESSIFLLLRNLDRLPRNNEVVPTETNMCLLFLHAGQVKGRGDLSGDKKV
jgi:hypothetical protein